MFLVYWLVFISIRMMHQRLQEEGEEEEEEEEE
jgi:hypothetical protein